MEDPSLVTYVALILVVKILAFYSYYSTDFDVHRNWLSITYSLPLSKWYTENTSEWTLDYPPFFAYFEFLLAQIGVYFDLQMLKIQKEPYSSVPTVLFQRSTVILGDLFLLYSSLVMGRALKNCSKLSKNRAEFEMVAVVLAIFSNAGIFLVDNIHFQYNGFLFGLLILSMKFILEEKMILGSLVYLVLLNFKHIYVYMAPAYVAYLFRNYLASESVGTNFFEHLFRLKISKIVKLGATILAVILASFGPFSRQILDVLARLFPFKRGLTHAYWAPNFWAIYNFGDMVLAKVFGSYLKKFGLLDDEIRSGFSSGLVQEHSHLVLPTVTPGACALCTVICILPFFGIGLSKKGTFESFLKLVILSSFSAFLFGWHVHEKAILLITVPLTVLSVKNTKYFGVFMVLTTVGNFSLFPLFFTNFEYPVMYLVAIVVWFIMVVLGIFLDPNPNFLGSLLRTCAVKFNWFEILFLLGLVGLEICKSLLNFVEFGRKYEFLPLMVTSVYCAFGVLYCWVKFLVFWINDELYLGIFLQKRYWTKMQERMKHEVKTENLDEWAGKNVKEMVKIVAGLDISTPEGDYRNACVACTVYKFPEMKLVHTEVKHVTIDKPYIAGLLAFRECDCMVETVTLLVQLNPKYRPDLIFVDGNGILHPRSFGLACSVGLTLVIPCVGVAKNLHLTQGIDKDTLNLAKNSKRPEQVMYLKDEMGKIIGAAVRCNMEAKNPIYVSVGNNIDLKNAIQATILCSNHRIPEPIRMADQISRAEILKRYDL